MTYLLALLLIVHGSIHLLGFAKGFNPRVIPMLTEEISTAAGFIWFFTSLLFYTTAVLLLLNYTHWWMLMLLAVGVSEGLIISDWRDAKAGTLINIMALGLMLLILLQ